MTEFYLEQLGTGQLHYMPDEWWIWVASSDSFTISVLLETTDASVFVDTIYNHSIAVVWSWVNPTHTSYLVRESDSLLELTFRFVLLACSCVCKYFVGIGILILPI